MINNAMSSRVDVQRFFRALCAASAEAVLDDSIDWRQRLLWGVGRQSLTDDGTKNGGESWTDTDHASAGLQLAPGLVICARDADGSLIVRNEGAELRYIVGIITASSPISPRPVVA